MEKINEKKMLINLNHVKRVVVYWNKIEMMNNAYT